MQSLSILWAVQGTSGSFALAGIATGAFAAAEAFGSPQVARVVDSRGQSAVARVQLPVFGLATVTLLLGTALGSPAWTWILASGVAGISCPRIGSLAAARWRHLTEGTGHMPAALALEAAVNQLTHMIGPVLVTTLGATIHPSSGLLIALVLVLVFTATLMVQRDSEPPTQPRGPGLVLDTRLLKASFAPFPVLHLLLGVYFGGMTICLTAAALSLGVGQYAGVMASAGGVASLLAGLTYGALAGRVNPSPVMLAGAGGLTAACFALGQTHGPVTLAAFTAIASACISPIIVPAAVNLQRRTPQALYVQAITWTDSASALGTAAAAPLIGQVVDHGSAQAGYLWIAGAVFLMLLTACWIAAGRNTGHPTRSEDATEP
jgi:hypothetical protein